MTIVHSASPTTLDEGYQLRLPTFEGPLDVLLRLIEREQLAITDVSLVAVTEQFLRHVAALVTDDPTVVADFSTVATRLLLLKSRSLLPRPLAHDDEPIGDLVEELIARRDLQRAAQHLRNRQLADLSTFTRPTPDARRPEESSTLRLAAHAPAALVGALRRRLSVSRPAAAVVAVRRAVSIGELIERTLRVVRQGRPVEFRELARLCGDADEVRGSFLAVLVLTRRRIIEADQATLFGAIHLRRIDATAVDRVPSTALVADDGALPA